MRSHSFCSKTWNFIFPLFLAEGHFFTLINYSANMFDNAMNLRFLIVVKHVYLMARREWGYNPRVFWFIRYKYLNGTQENNMHAKNHIEVPWEIYVAFPKIFGKKFVFYSQPHVNVHSPTFFSRAALWVCPPQLYTCRGWTCGDDVALAALQTPWRRTSACFKWHPQKHGYPS